MINVQLLVSHRLPASLCFDRSACVCLWAMCVCCYGFSRCLCLCVIEVQIHSIMNCFVSFMSSNQNYLPHAYHQDVARQKSPRVLSTRHCLRLLNTYVHKQYGLQSMCQFTHHLIVLIILNTKQGGELALYVGVFECYFHCNFINLQAAHLQTHIACTWACTYISLLEHLTIQTQSDFR